MILIILKEHNRYSSIRTNISIVHFKTHRRDLDLRFSPSDNNGQFHCRARKFSSLLRFKCNNVPWWSREGSDLSIAWTSRAQRATRVPGLSGFVNRGGRYARAIAPLINEPPHTDTLYNEIGCVGSRRTKVATCRF